MKRNVWLCQVNHLYGRNCFLPYSVGLIQVYAQKFQEIKDNYNFAGFIYLREDPKEIIKRMEATPPDVLGVSCYIWNWTISLALAKAVKERWPNCLVVLGGPHVPNESKNFFKEHWYCDILVHGEGEVAFYKILKERLKNVADYDEIGGLSIRTLFNFCHKTGEGNRIIDLDEIPSPYLEGVFDELVKEDYNWSPSFEATRGCPYSCTFCDWGGSVFTKVRKFDEQRLLDEIDWFSDKKVDMVTDCDANYGMFERDVLFVERMAELKKKTGYPNKFRAAFAKNSGDRVYRINKILNDAGMSKGATLSFQSMDEKTLETVKRKNIGVKVFSDLMKKYRAEDIPTYSELIIGLPGETYDSFADGIDLMLNCGQMNSINIYILEALPNSEMSQPEYIEKHGIKFADVPVMLYHGTPVVDEYQEMYKLVIETATLPHKDWLKCCLFSWAVQTFCCLGLSQKVAAFLKGVENVPYRVFFENLIRWAKKNPNTLIGKITSEAENLYAGIPEGKQWGVIDQRFGNVVWPPEEGLFLKLIAKKEKFYQELREHLQIYFDDQGLLDIVLNYQKLLIKGPIQEKRQFLTSCKDFHEQMENIYYDRPTVFEQLTDEEFNAFGLDSYETEEAPKYKDLEEYAREVVWFGRKGSTGLFHKIKQVKSEEPILV